MLTKEDIEWLKADWLSFEQIQELNKRLEKIDNGKAVFLDEKEFWDWVYKQVNINIKNKEKCLK